MQIFIYDYMFWADVIAESEVFYLAKSLDGVNVYVIKDGSERVRNKPD